MKNNKLVDEVIDLLNQTHDNLEDINSLIEGNANNIFTKTISHILFKSTKIKEIKEKEKI